jgi:hypothetical protein
MKLAPIAAFLCLALSQLSAAQEQTEPLDPGLRDPVTVAATFTLKPRHVPGPASP